MPDGKNKNIPGNVNPTGIGGVKGPADFTIQDSDLPRIFLGPKLRGVADFYGVRNRLLNTLNVMRGQKKFADLFGSLGKVSGPQQGKVFLGADALQALLDTGKIKNQSRINLFNQLLGGIPEQGGEEPPAEHHGGGGGSHGGGGLDFHGRLGELLHGPPQIDPRIMQGLVDQVLELLANPGFDPELLARSRNNIRGDSRIAERDAILRRADDFSARGLFGSGLQARDIERIEDTAERGRKDALLSLDRANQEQISTSIAQAMQGANLLHSMNLGNFGGTLDAMALALSEMLGTRGLDLQELELLSNNIMDEFIRNLALGGFSGFSPGGGELGSGGSSELFPGGLTLRDLIGDFPVF